VSEAVLDLERAEAEICPYSPAVDGCGPGIGRFICPDSWCLAGRSARDTAGTDLNVWLLVTTFSAIFGGIYFILGCRWPILRFTLPRYGLSTQTFKGWVIDQVKGVSVGSAGALVLEVICAV
jgi:hypothetical protein